MTAAKQHIATAPKDGKVIFVGDGRGNIGKVFWHGTADAGQWCYGHPDAPDQPWHGLDWRPTHWSDKPGVFL